MYFYDISCHVTSFFYHIRTDAVRKITLLKVSRGKIATHTVCMYRSFITFINPVGLGPLALVEVCVLRGPL